MPKVELEIPQAEYDIIREAALKMNVPAQKLIQQELDAALVSISVWAQRVCA